MNLCFQSVYLYVCSNGFTQEHSDKVATSRNPLLLFAQAATNREHFATVGNCLSLFLLHPTAIGYHGLGVTMNVCILIYVFRIGTLTHNSTSRHPTTRGGRWITTRSDAKLQRFATQRPHRLRRLDNHFGFGTRLALRFALPFATRLGRLPSFSPKLPNRLTFGRPVSGSTTELLRLAACTRSGFCSTRIL